MDHEDVPMRAVEPRQQDELISRTEVCKPVAHLFLENQRCRRGAFIGLPGRRIERPELGFNVANRPQLESGHSHLVTSDTIDPSSI
jgi:hypothetical protein